MALPVDGREQNHVSLRSLEGMDRPHHDPGIPAENAGKGLLDSLLLGREGSDDAEDLPYLLFIALFRRLKIFFPPRDLLIEQTPVKDFLEQTI